MVSLWLDWNEKTSWARLELQEINFGVKSFKLSLSFIYILLLFVHGFLLIEKK